MRKEQEVIIYNGKKDKVVAIINEFATGLIKYKLESGKIVEEEVLFDFDADNYIEEEEVSEFEYELIEFRTYLNNLKEEAKLAVDEMILNIKEELSKVQINSDTTKQKNK